MEYTFEITQERYEHLCSQPFFRNFIKLRPSDNSYVHIKVTLDHPREIMDFFFGVTDAGERAGNLASLMKIKSSFDRERRRFRITELLRAASLF